jgi:hypothetical protein
MGINRQRSNERRAQPAKHARLSSHEKHLEYARENAPIFAFAQPFAEAPECAPKS